MLKVVWNYYEWKVKDCDSIFGWKCVQHTKIDEFNKCEKNRNGSFCLNPSFWVFHCESSDKIFYGGPPAVLNFNHFAWILVNLKIIYRCMTWCFLTGWIFLVISISLLIVDHTNKILHHISKFAHGLTFHRSASSLSCVGTPRAG